MQPKLLKPVRPGLNFFRLYISKPIHISYSLKKSKKPHSQLLDTHPRGKAPLGRDLGVSSGYSSAPSGGTERAQRGWELEGGSTDGTTRRYSCERERGVPEY